MNESAASVVRRGPVPRNNDARQAKENAKVEDVATVSPGAPRKLIRPRLPEGFVINRRPDRLSAMPLSVSAGKTRLPEAIRDSSHAEAFYFQKQIQSQTLMIFELEDGQRIEGYIEWYDRHCIKVKHSHRTLIYKDSIKYLYKATEQPKL